jgi:proton-coupled amino acid transporter
MISFVGAGLLGVPNAFQRGGWLLSTFTYMAVSALNLYAMLLLPKIKRSIVSSNEGSAAMVNSYGDIGRYLLGTKGELLVNVCLGISQAGFATGYVIFIAANIQQELGLARWIVCVACIPGLSVLVQFQRMKDLSIFSMLANCANAAALLAVLFEDYESYTSLHNDMIHPVKWSGLLHIIAITIYSLEGVGLVLSLESSCKHQNRFPMLLQLVIAGISVFSSLFGCAGYFAFGDATEAPVTLNLAGSWAARFVKLALCLGLYLTFPVMMFPVWSISETIYPVLKEDSKMRIMFRCCAVLGSVLVGYSVPNFGKFMSLVGSSICTILGFILPCYFALTTLEMKRHERCLNAALIVGGTIFGILGTAESVLALIRGEDTGE